MILCAAFARVNPSILEPNLKGATLDRRDKLIQQQQHDPYFSNHYKQDPAMCKHCGVFFGKGHFSWAGNKDNNTVLMECPACQRIRDGYEGGLLTISGGFARAHRAEILNLIGNTEELEKQQRPLERIIDINKGKTMEVTTTYEHLARRLGKALSRAYKGDLQMSYPKGEKFIRISWVRED
jgi:hypothetical protein